MNEALRLGLGVAGNREGDIHCDQFLPNQPRIGAYLPRYVSFYHRQGQIEAQQLAGPEAGLGIDTKGSGLDSQWKSPGTKDRNPSERGEPRPIVSLAHSRWCRLGCPGSDGSTDVARLRSFIQFFGA